MFYCILQIRMEFAVVVSRNGGISYDFANIGVTYTPSHRCDTVADPDFRAWWRDVWLDRIVGYISPKLSGLNDN